MTDIHPTEAELAACVQCGLCLPHCPTYRLTGLDTASPRGRLMAMSAVAEGDLEVNDSFRDIMSFCLECRACEAVCPSLVPFGRAMEGARAEVAAQAPGRGQRLRAFVLGRVLGSPTLMRLVTLGARLVRALRLERMLPKALAAPLAGVRPLHGAHSSRGTVAGTGRLGTAALLAGCVMDPWFEGVQKAAIELLVRAGYRVVVPENQTCCGALAAHDGAAAEARRLAERNVDVFAGVDLVVATAAGCSAHLVEYGHWAKDGADLARRSRDVTMVVADLIERGELPRLESDLGPVAVQDPCHLRHAQRETRAPRTILAAAGYTPVDVDPTGMCCGAAGIYSLLYPDTSRLLGERKAAEVATTGSTLVASANPGCEMQLRQHLDGWYRVAHPIEIYLEALAADSQ
ncbi:MAG TPA: (Fe-S)-binding protein [Acidimicrobiia bacterium]|nr:(Fe-S)-binding protein [Acidimicrobiia bacterium]